MEWRRRWTTTRRALVFDIGAHKGEDTDYYLECGYRVVAVDADPLMVRQLADRFARACEAERLTVLNYAVTDEAGRSARLHRSEVVEWTSLIEGIADRRGMHGGSIEVETITLGDLIDRYGLPYYCKIDIEGLDVVALRSLDARRKLPRYVSVETECLPDKPQEHDPLETLAALRQLGYDRFKLVDQASLSVLGPDRPFYSSSDGDGDGDDRPPFPFGSSGPFGRALSGSWLGFDTAAATLEMQRTDYFETTHARPDGFWCDWHATRSPGASIRKLASPRRQAPPTSDTPRSNAPGRP